MSFVSLSLSVREARKSLTSLNESGTVWRKGSVSLQKEGGYICMLARVQKLNAGEPHAPRCISTNQRLPPVNPSRCTSTGLVLRNGVSNDSKRGDGISPNPQPRLFSCSPFHISSFSTFDFRQDGAGFFFDTRQFIIPIRQPQLSFLYLPPLPPPPPSQAVSL